MKKSKYLSLFTLCLMSIILVAALNATASEIEGFTFEKGSFYEIPTSASFGTPSTVEATVYLSDNTASNGTIFGNIWDPYPNYPTIDFRIIENGMPQIYIMTKRETFVSYDFTEVKVETGKFVTLRFVIDRSVEGAHKACLYVDGELKQTIESEKISTVSSIPMPFVIGGNRELESKTFTANPNYFKGVISKLTLWKTTAYPESSEMPVAIFDYNSEGNTKEVIRDQTGNGNDADWIERYISAEELPERIDDYAYSFAVLGDPQFVAQENPAAFKPMYEWIIEQDPEYMICLGDIQNIYDESEKSHKQWKVAQEAIYLLDEAGIPHTHIRGNHDYSSMFNEYLPWSRYGEIYDGITAGAYAENVLNTWRKIEIGDTKWLILGLDWKPGTDVINWAADVIEKNPDYNVIIATHYYITLNGKIPSDESTLQNIWNKIANKYENVVMVLCGHVHTDNIVYTQRENSVGTTVTEMLIDFQYCDLAFDETAAIATMFHFSKDGKTLQIENYSTYNNAYYKKTNQFTIELDTLDVEVSEVDNDGTPDYDLTAASASGTIDGYTWSLCGDTLVISGKADSGALTDASAISAYAKTVKKIVIENSTEIKKLGDSLFSGFTACETVVVPARLNNIGSKTFENMTSLSTIALYNEFYGENFESIGEFDLYNVEYFATDSFSGIAKEGIIFFMPEKAKITGDAQRFSPVNSIYYVYPSGNVADLIRDNAADEDSVRYYTYEMTGRSDLVTKGTNLLDDGTGNMFEWVFDNNTGTLSITFLGGDALYRVDQGFNDWKQIWKEAVTTINVYGTATYNKIQIFARYGNNTGIFDGYKNLKTIFFEKYGNGSVAKNWAMTAVETSTFGFFSDNPKLTTIGLGSLTEGVVDISKLVTVNDILFNKMFKGCTSITTVILPDKPSGGGTNLYTSMFSGCTSLKKVTLPSILTTIGANSFAGCTSLASLVLPNGITSVGATAFDTSMMLIAPNLNVYDLVKAHNYNVAIDLRETALADFEIDRADETTTLQVLLSVQTGETEYTKELLMDKFGKNVEYVVYPSTPAADVVRALAKNDETIKIKYYSEEFYSELVRSGTVSQNGAEQFSYSFDDETGILTITTLTKYAMLRGSNYAGQTFIPWKKIWKNEITGIEVIKSVGGNKIQYQAECSTGLFDNYPNLVTIRFNSVFPTMHNNAYGKFGIFENNPNLESIASNATAEFVYGLANIMHVNNTSSANTFNKAFRNCPKIEKVIFRDDINSQYAVKGFGDSIFSGCTALKELSFYNSTTKTYSSEMSAWVTTIGENAFKDCVNLKHLLVGDKVTTVASTAFNGASTKLVCTNETQVENINTALTSGTTSAKAVALGSLSPEGISIRTEKYNGLRYVYSFDNDEKLLLENAGYSLREYGLLVCSAENMASATISKNESDVYLTGEKVKKLAVYDSNNGGICGKILSSSTEDTTIFAGTVINFSENNVFNDVFIGAYSVYLDPDGNEYISYSDYGNVNKEYKTSNLFKVTYDMYANEDSSISEKVVDEIAVWNILLLGADLPSYKNLAIDGFSDISLTFVNDGNGNYLAFLRSGDVIPEEAYTKAQDIISKSGYTPQIIKIRVK